MWAKPDTWISAAKPDSSISGAEPDTSISAAQPDTHGSDAAQHDSTEAFKISRIFAPGPAACSAAPECAAAAMSWHSLEDVRFATGGEKRFDEDGTAYTYGQFCVGMMRSQA